MKKKERRSLAYVLAKTIDMDSLSSISGGARGMGMQWCSRNSMKASGSGIQSLDVIADVVVDF